VGGVKIPPLPIQSGGFMLPKGIITFEMIYQAMDELQQDIKKFKEEINIRLSNLEKSIEINANKREVK
jgi:hypothetical protein